MNKLFGEPIVRVGLCEGSGFGLHPYGRYSVNASETMITYQPLEENAYMQVSGVEIGRQFHWESRQTLRYGGVIQLLRKEDKSILLNILKAEEYLQSVTGSEMHPDAPSEFVKAHAIISRSWLMRMQANKLLQQQPEQQPEQQPGRNISWTSVSAHSDYDVCCDDHCQRYQGLDAVTQGSRDAVKATRGLVLADSNGEIADTRYSKCCGGKTELFSTCWETVDYPYLTSRVDPFCSPQRLKRALSKHPVLLKDYDAHTADYFEWERCVRPDLIQSNLKERFGVDIGEIIDIKPLAKGPSGRIYELSVIGNNGTVTIGKELSIRRLLSDSHLLSSAFTIQKRGGAFVLNGRGWGHGVGLCQIGAAVMAVEGHSCEEILSFYYPGTSITSIYD